MKHNPLVSVFVVCFNAADYIIETLESIKAQTYKAIELIVSDDNSSDNTLVLIREWIKKNSDRFVRTEIITVEKNTGVSANYNRAVSACRGEWLKNVDGDDLLMPNCILDNINYIHNNPKAKIVFSDLIIFSGSSPKKEMGHFFNNEMKLFFEKDPELQFIDLLYNNILPSQTCFIEAELLRNHPYNERYKGLEDAPTWIAISKGGNKIFYFDKCTALYRKSESLTSSSERFISPIYLESSLMYYWSEKIDYIKSTRHKGAYEKHMRYFFLMFFVVSVLHNKKTRFNSFLFKIVRRLILKYAHFDL